MADISHVFVATIPAALDPKTLYICRKYRVAAHLCMCGCGTKVITPLGPAEWSLRYDGSTVTLSPSIGNGGLPCRSHYFITRSAVRWLPPVGAHALRVAYTRDEHDLRVQLARERRSWRRLVAALQRWIAR